MFQNLLNHALIQLIIFAVLYALIFIFIQCDLRAGIRKAKKNGEFRSSHKYRQTVDKIARYYNAIFVLTVIDIVQMLAIYMIDFQIGWHIPEIPIFTFGGTFFIGFIEFKSIYEKSDDKEQARISDTAKMMMDMLHNALKDHSPEDVMSAFVKYLNSNTKKDESNG